MNHDNYECLSLSSTEDTPPPTPSVHAEEVALDKLSRNKILRKGKFVKVSLLVVRITPRSVGDRYVLNNSRPCIVCTCRMLDIAQSGYIIKKVYYSDLNGEIVCSKFRDFVAEPHYKSKNYKRKKLPKKCQRYQLTSEVEE